MLGECKIELTEKGFLSTNIGGYNSSYLIGCDEIDMIIERADMITNLCEIKYTNKPFTIDAAYEQQLLRKRDVYKEKTGTTQALKIIMISAKGLSGTTHTSYIADVITLDDLFEG